MAVVAVWLALTGALFVIWIGLMSAAAVRVYWPWEDRAPLSREAKMWMGLALATPLTGPLAPLLSLLGCIMFYRAARPHDLVSRCLVIAGTVVVFLMTLSAISLAA